MARDYVSNDADIPAGTLVELFFDAVDAHSDTPALQSIADDGSAVRSIRYSGVWKLVATAVSGLRALGMERGQRAAILAENRPEWALADYACLCAGVLDVPIYSTLTAAQVVYILEDSGARIAFASTAEQMEKLLEARKELGGGLTVVVFDDVEDPPDGVMTWGAFLERGREHGAAPEAIREEALAAEPDDVMTILYTSGTTGDPKGVMLTHGNLHSNVTAAGMVLPMNGTDSTLSFLPLSHVLQRMVDYLLFARGSTIAYARSIETVAEDLRIVRPTVVVAVPRVYEKVYNRVMEVGGIRAPLVRWAGDVAVRWTDADLSGRSPGVWLGLQHAVANRLVYNKIRAAVGGRVRYFVSGSAPLEPDIAKFFYGAGLKILEGYGLTETSPVTNVNTLDRFKIGAVGPPIPGTEIRIAEDGEILVRGPQVMKGYYGLPEETERAIDRDGWFHTGDVGEIDEDGFLKITDRKKDIIVTAGGKNVAPQPIENRLKTNPFVEQVVMVGDRRKFCSLLVVPAFGRLESWAEGEGIEFSDRGQLIRDPAVQKKMGEEVLGGLEDLARYERPKKIALLESEFTVEDGTLTPTQKVKRRVVQKRFDALIDRFYLDENVSRAVLAATDPPESEAA